MPSPLRTPRTQTGNLRRIKNRPALGWRFGRRERVGRPSVGDCTRLKTHLVDSMGNETRL